MVESLRRRAALVALAAFLALPLLAARPARAQASDPELRPTRGPYITDGARAGDADATAVQLNPGALGFLPAAGLELVGAYASDPAVVPRRGLGAYLGLPIFLRSSLGLGLSRVTGASAVGIDAHTTLQLAYALHFLRNASLGVSWAHIWDGSFAGADTFDFGFSARVGRYVAFGATVEDVAEPHPNAFGATLPRLWTAELLLRPLGTARLEVALGAAHANADDWDRLVPRARVSVTLVDGLRLYGEGENVPRGTGSTFGDGSDTRLAFGMAIDFDHLGAVVGVPIFIPGTGSSGAGIAGRLHLDGERRPALAAPAYVARVRLEGIDDDRHFFQVVRRLRALAVDPAVAGVLFKIEGVNLGYARIEELRDLVALLRAHGKRTFGYLTFPSTREYYLAAACDVILVHPAGELSVTGVATNVSFYKDSMDRLGVHLELVRIGAFKGAMEPFVMTEQSPAVRENKNQLLDDVYGRVTAAIAADRTRAGHPMDAAIVRGLIDRGIFSPGDANAGGARRRRRRRRGSGAVRPARARPRQPQAARSRSVAARAGRLAEPPRRRAVRRRHDGRRPEHRAAVRAGRLRRLRHAGGGAGAVPPRPDHRRGRPAGEQPGRLGLRLGRPGARDQEGARGRQADRRLDGRSGGLGRLLHRRAGRRHLRGAVDDDRVDRRLRLQGRRAEAARHAGDQRRDLSQGRARRLPVALSALDRGRSARWPSSRFAHLYQLFVATVADGRRTRGLTAARVDELGRGHVWTGAQAQGLGLVDRLGGLSAAVDEAARLGGVPVGRDQLPDLALLPVENQGPPAPVGGRGIGPRRSGRRRGRSVVTSARRARRIPTAIRSWRNRQACSPTTRARRCGCWRRSWFKVKGAGFSARLPYDFDLR